ncbi:MAG TPA: hypothetical protein DEP07_01120 [Brevibacillus sp.]|nr:hypothetical protein [Brevibacillus sp.]
MTCGRLPASASYIQHEREKWLARHALSRRKIAQNAEMATLPAVLRESYNRAIENKKEKRFSLELPNWKAIFF